MLEAHTMSAGHGRGQRGLCPLVSENTDQRSTGGCCTVSDRKLSLLCGPGDLVLNLGIYGCAIGFI